MVLSKAWALSLPLVGLFVLAGWGHFAAADDFVGIMRGMPFPALHPAANLITGVLE